ncbi:endonuclease/exonuclease/phosphatase family protein [Streptomyces milbemycinicus]|uniref:Endonuclease/exonuclease/phosphatase family protein n=1 Tax=Streptomyces milbemycinicus TaxID=476552 RepID=A0ABW8M2P8_9ACTN
MIGLLAVVGVVTPAYAEPEAEESLAYVPNRVMSWNSGGEEEGTPQLIVQQVRSFRPQLVALQESCQNEVREAVRQLKEVGLEYVHVRGLSAQNAKCPGPLGTAILYAKGTPMVRHSRKEYTVDEGWSEKRGYQTFSTKIAGRWVQVFNTHLSAPAYPDLRRQQILELTWLTQLDSQKLVFGDFNAQPWYYEMGPIWRDRLVDVDKYCKMVYDRRCNGTQVGSGKKFDYILHHGVGSRNCLLHTVNLDHRVVISDVTAAPGRRRPCTVT